MILLALLSDSLFPFLNFSFSTNLFFKPFTGACGAEPHIRKGLMYALRKYEVPADTQTWVYLRKRKDIKVIGLLADETLYMERHNENKRSDKDDRKG